MAEEIKAYKPKCCNKAFVRKWSAVRHEKNCPKNPDNKACYTCGYCRRESNTVYVRPHGDQNYGDADYEEYYLWCDYEEKIISSYPNGKDPDECILLQKKCCYWIPEEGD